MYAVIKSGGKQHRVVEGETLRGESISWSSPLPADFQSLLAVLQNAR